MISRRTFGLGALAMTGDGLVRPINAPPGGQLAPGVQPGVSTGIILAQFVIVFGANNGVFVYSGKPGPGNPPIAWMSSGLKDPYGNVLPSTTGIAGSGTFQAGNTRITPTGTYSYSSTPALGNLIASDTTLTPASATGTDGLGNTTYAGRCSYAVNGTATPTFIVQLFNGNLSMGPPSEITGAGGLTPGGLTPGLGFMDLNSGTSTAADAFGGIAVNSTLTAPGAPGVPVVTLTGALALQSFAAAPATTVTPYVFADANGFPNTKAANDSNIYNLGKATKIYTGAGQLVNAVAFTQVGPCALAVLSGIKYRYRAMVFYTGSQAAGNPVLSFGHITPAMTRVTAYETWALSGAAVSQTNSDLSFLDVNGPTLNTGRTCYTSEGEFQPSANGTLTLTAACTVAADTWTIQRAFLEIEPTEG